jgi:hypothetical protein
VNILRFACGAVSPPFEGSFRDWVEGEIKAHKGYAVGRKRHDGRYRVIAYDVDGQSMTPRMPKGQVAPCLNCPCPREAGRREVEAKRVDLRGIRRIIVTCYPEEVSAKDRSPAERTGLDDATRKVASPGPVRNDQEHKSCFIHGDFESFDCPQCPVRNDRMGSA